MRHFVKLVRPYMIWAVVMIIVPLLLIVLYSVTTGGNDLVNIQFTLDNFKRMTEPVYVAVFLKSFRLGLLSVAICLVIGYILAYFISRFNEKIQNILVLFVTIPMWINTLLRTYAWMGLLSLNGPVNAVLGVFGLGPYNMLNTSGAVVLGMVYNYLPYMILPLYTAMTKIDNSVVEAAQDLGANVFQILGRVLIPLSKPGIATGITMVFVPAVSTFIISRMLGGGANLLIGDLIELQFLGNSYNLNLGSAMSLVLMVIVLLCMSFTSSFDEEEMEGVM